MPDSKRKKDFTRILTEAKKAHSEELLSKQTEGTEKLVIFSLENQLYAVYSKIVKEILSKVSIHRVPGTPPFIPGIINVRGDIESIFDLRPILKHESKSLDSLNRIIIASQDGIRSGIIVEKIQDVTDIPKSDIEPPLSTLDNSIREFVIGGFLYLTKHVTLLNIGIIFRKFSDGSNWSA